LTAESVKNLKKALGRRENIFVAPKSNKIKAFPSKFGETAAKHSERDSSI
jgi:hypothetical protein